MEKNQATFEAENVVSFYENYHGLQKPEAFVLKIFEDKLANFSVLDIGVGTGRTTPFFGFKTKEYIGVDYADNMISKCKAIFADKGDHLKFEVADARQMEQYQDESFDLILFAFNGLDYIPPHERSKTIKEIRRVLKKGGHFCFSTHNLQSVPSMFEETYGYPKNLLKLRKVMRAIKFRLHNESYKSLITKKWALVNDGEHGYGLKTYYVRPLEQVKELEKHNFKDIQIIDVIDGKVLKEQGSILEAKDIWLYYLCEK